MEIKGIKQHVNKSIKDPAFLEIVNKKLDRAETETKTKPETRQEMAEWLAGEVLGWEFIPADDDCGYDIWHDKGGGLGLTTFNMIEHMYSPEGLFSVLGSTWLMPRKDILCEEWEQFFYNLDYDAFFSGVWEAL